MSVTYTTAQGNAGSLTHRARSGIASMSSRIPRWVLNLLNLNVIYRDLHLICSGLHGLFFFLPFLGPLLRHMEVPRLGVELEL